MRRIIIILLRMLVMATTIALPMILLAKDKLHLTIFTLGLLLAVVYITLLKVIELWEDSDE